MDSKVYLQEAFRALDVLNEEDFNLDTSSGQDDFTKFLSDDKKADEFIDIIDPETTEETELKDDYLGKVILDCCVCHSKLYKDRDDVVFIEDEDIVNEDEECPFCYSTDGFKIIGMIAPYEEVEEKEEIEVEDESEYEDVEVEADDKVEEGCSPKKRNKNKKLREATSYNFSANAVKEELSARQLKSPKRYVYEICDKLGWRPPMFIDAVAGGYRLRYREDSKEEAQATLDDIQRVAAEMGIEVKRPTVKPTGQLSANDDWKEYEGPRKKDAFGRDNPDWDSEEFQTWKWANYHPTYYSYIVIPAYEEKVESFTYDDEDDFDESLNESADISEYQKWVDFDMKKYGRISGVTMRKIKAAGFSVVKDQYGDYEVIADRKDECMMTSEGCHNRPRRGFRKVEEDFERVEIETDKEKMEMTADEEGKVTVTTEPKEETVVPVDDMIQTEINPREDEPVDVPEEEVAVEDKLEVEDPEEDIDISDFSEEEFDELGESYLKKIYENVVSYKTDNVYNHKNGVIIEGTINFNSGNKKKTSFIFESSGINKNGKMRLIGENAQITRGKKAFIISGKMDQGKFIAESLNYNYRTKNSDGQSTRIYGTLRINEAAGELSTKSNSISSLFIKNKDRIDNAGSKEELVSILSDILKNNNGAKAKSVLANAKAKKNLQSAMQYIYDFILAGDNLRTIDGKKRDK